MKESSAAPHASGGALIHEIIPVGWLQCNCSIIGDPATREALVLDPGDEVERIEEILKRHQLTVKAIVSTHAHIDHVGGLKKLHDLTGAPVMMHADDLQLYQALDRQAKWLGMRAPAMTEVHQLLKEGDALRWGPFEAHVMHTPGHTPGSVCLYLPRGAGKIALKLPHLFAGDTLFAGSIGRTDLWGGSFEEIMRSLRGKLLALPDETLVFPGHGPKTTIGAERDSNPFLLVK
ncbi:MAG TPA: MBL fold metallo-hydrolase [Candidatus Acidoferrum sp.]|nr:MBL fold metallo-hydrolase [Candidatus Acidoferrum sp.]